MSMQIIIFGGGAIGRQCLEYIGRENVAFFCDNNNALIGRSLCGVQIIGYKELLDLKKADDNIAILVSVRAAYAEQIMGQLMADGIMDAFVIDERQLYADYDELGRDQFIDRLRDGMYRRQQAQEWLYHNWIKEKSVTAYLKRHIEVSTMKPATGKLRRKQQWNTVFTRRVLDFLEENCPVRCWIDYGMLLGKLRHNGWIPWDDDVDLGIMRKDMQKIIRFFEQYSIAYIPEDLYGNRGAVGVWEQMVQTQDRHAGKYIFERMPDACRIAYHDPDNGWGVVEFWLYDYVNDDVTLDQVNESIRQCEAIKTAGGGRRMIDVVEDIDRLIARTEYISYEETERIVPAIDNGLYVRIKKAHDLADAADVFPLQNLEFEGTMLPFPNHMTKVLELSYPNWQGIPNDVGIGHQGVILDD